MPFYLNPSSITRPARIGVTGGIGSGKSAVCRILESMGFPVYYADLEAKRLLNSDPELIARIKAIFGEAAYFDGEYNRLWIAQQVFSNPDKLAALNAAVHPAVERDAQAWMERMNEQGHAFPVKEAALMIESGSYKNLNLLILVTAPESVRIQRVMERDHLSEEAVRKRMAAQMPDEEKRRYVHFVIENSGSLETLEKRVREVIDELIFGQTEYLPMSV